MNTQKLRGGLSAILICCLVLPIFAQTNANETFVICTGDSVFLEALQFFPAGPQPPQGVSQCFPQLQDIEINTTTNVSQVEKRGFLVSPQETTIYEVTSIPTCGPPGFGGIIGPAPGAIIRTYEVIVDASCQAENLNTQLFVQYPWLSTIVNATFCSIASIQVYQQGAFNFLLVTNELVEEVLYFEDGTRYCNNSPSYDCVAAYNLGQPIETWRCPNPLACPAVFKPVCGVDGRTYGNGCEAAIVGVQVVFQGECPSVQPPINCEGFTGTVIQNECGTFIQTEESVSTRALISPLYEEGVIVPSVGDLVEFSYTGLGAADNFCLGYPSTAGSVTCLKIVGATIPESYIFNDYPWLSDQINPNSCTNEKVEVYQSGVYFYLLITDANGQANLYNQNGQFYCQHSFSYDCLSAYNLGNPIETWSCQGGQTGPRESIVIRTAACVGERFEFPYPVVCNGRQMQLPMTNDIIEQIAIDGANNIVIAVLKNYGSFERRHLVSNGSDCEEVVHIYEMVEREDCGSESPAEIPSVYEDYPWLRSTLAPIECESTNGEKIIFFNNDPNRGQYNNNALEMYQSGGFTYFLVQYEPSIHATLYFEDGSLLCTNSIGYDCVEAYGLGNPVASWRCVRPVFLPCTDDINPVCGSDGRTYTNECEAQRAGVEVVTTGECPNVPPEAPDELFFDYPWLTDIINPNACTSEKIAVYQSGIYFYLLVTDASGQATLYNQDGLFYCQQTPSYDCVAAYNLGQPIDTWDCNIGIGCPAVVMPACGVDGNTYDINPCVQSNGDIEIAYLGTCDPGPVVCDMFIGNVIENECGLFISVSNQYWRPIFLGGVTVPSGGDIVEFAFFPRSLSDYPDDGCLTNPNGTPPIVGVVSCLNVTNQRSFKEIYTICPGESVFLKAKRSEDFAVGTGSTCFPMINDIAIFPTTDSDKKGTIGYDVSPEQSTVYAIESLTSCPDVYRPIQSINYYQVIVDYNCTLYPDCTTSTSRFRATGTIVESICNTVVVDLENNNSGLIGLLSVIYSPCVTTPIDIVGTQVEIDFEPVPYIGSCPPAQPGGAIYAYNARVLDSQENCNNNSGTVFFRNCDNGQEYYFIRTEDGRIFDPYFGDNIVHIPVDGQKVNFGFIDADFLSPCSIAEKAITITCIEVAADNSIPEGDCSNYQGEIFFDKCDDGREFYFIRSNTGEVFDPYFTQGINFVKYPGQKVRFDFVPADFISPCSIADQAVIITCIEENNTSEVPPSPIFLDYPWLTEVVNPNNCNGEKITFYQSGTYQFLFIEADGIGTLYFQDGTRYCQSSPTYDCITAYNLSTPIDTWECGAVYEEEETAFPFLSFYEEFPWLNDIITPIDCKALSTEYRLGYNPYPELSAHNSIEVYKKGIYYYFLFSYNGSGAPVLLFQDGTRYCTTSEGYSCVEAYDLGDPIAKWNCFDPFIVCAGNDPVCGVDGRTYQNSCVAERLGVAIVNQGNCPPDGDLQEPATNRNQMITQLEGFVAYPNPTLGMLQVQLPVLKHAAQLRISNLFGQQLLERQIPATSSPQVISMDLSDYQNGVYYLEFKTQGRRGIERIIKQDLR